MDVSPFDLPAYLDRIGLDHVPAPDAAGLAAVHHAHRLAIPFENLDIALGRGISIDPAAVFAKLIRARRGGYCFEQNQLFLRALHSLGFTARPLLARVWLLAQAVPPLTHTLNLVTIDGQDWIADAGFGGSLSPPMRVIDGARFDAADGTAHRLVRQDSDQWMLERAGHPAATDGRSADTHDWQPQYSFTLGQVEAIDLELSNHWTATRPDTRFTTLTLVSQVLADGFLSVQDRQVSLHRNGMSESRTIDDPADYHALLTQTLGLVLSEAETAHLFAR